MPGRYYAIEVDGIVAGGIGVEPYRGERIGAAAFGYWLGQAYWGRGIGTDAARTLSDDALANGSLRRLEARVFAPNVASARVLEKCGFPARSNVARILRRSQRQRMRRLDVCAASERRTMKGNTMYIPPHFEVSDRAWVLDLIERHPFGSLVTCEDESARISHLPLIAQERQDEIWLIGHVARNNPHAQSIVAQAAATLVFRGPHAYISASWYEEPYATVPTWNYTAAHVSGRLRQYDPWDAVKLLSAKLEGEKADALGSTATRSTVPR